MADKLASYHQKRRFDKTTEPRGATEKSSPVGLRFVVQHHIASRDHYDFRLEWAGTMKSWAVPKGPSYNPRDKRLAVQVEDHPLDYRNFEGTIPKGQYGGGTVMIWDEGTWAPLEDAAQGFETGSLKFALDGSRLRGAWALVRMKPKPGEKNVNWLLIKERDAFKNAYDMDRFDTSIRTGRTMADIARGAEGSMTDDGDGEDSVKQHGKKSTPGASKAATKAQTELSIAGVTVSSADKVLYDADGITKGDIASYYAQIAPRMLPYVQGRIISAVRCPKGIEACFFKKHPAGDNQGAVVVTVPSNDGEPEAYYTINDLHGLIGEVQMNTLEFHTWGSRVDTLETPDMMVFDLDPDVGMGLDEIRRGVRDIKGILDQLKLTAYLKTSGGKGYHIVLPFRPKADWEKFHAFAENVARGMEAMWPERYTANIRKSSRKGRIFIDWIRNGRGATSVAPYSVRARDGAPVSMPIAWDELASVAPGAITMQEAIRRLDEKDPWADFFMQAQELKA